MTEVVINGWPRRLPADATLDLVVREAGAPEGGRGVAVAVDGEVVPRAEWPSRTLAEGQRVEVLTAVQGG
ncbi:MAG TPA: sulfur carrier protein ThiS [Thermoleophilaceae bacterium]|nr:sulfur carrier protein ThiS [Thermoleophilaceae bacterium]